MNEDEKYRREDIAAASDLPPKYPVCDIEIEGIDYDDAPDFVDAYISYAVSTETGEPLTDDELDALNQDSSFVYQAVQDWIY